MGFLPGRAKPPPETARVILKPARQASDKIQKLGPPGAPPGRQRTREMATSQEITIPPQPILKMKVKLPGAAGKNSGRLRWKEQKKGAPRLKPVYTLATTGEDWKKIPVADLTVNNWSGRLVRLEWNGKITCIGCGRSTKKSFSQGYCYPCFKNRAETDTCIVRPELCHFARGTCRDEQFAAGHCKIPHIVYISLTAGAKVGVTREQQLLNRWVDQGAVEGISLARVPERLVAGQVEVALKQFIGDKTSWQKMLKNEINPEADLVKLRTEMMARVPAEFEQYLLKPAEVIRAGFDFPVARYPTKVKSFNLDKDPVVEDALRGVKGQYLIFDSGVINLRKYQGYEIGFTAGESRALPEAGLES